MELRTFPRLLTLALAMATLLAVVSASAGGAPLPVLPSGGAGSAGAGGAGGEATAVGSGIGGGSTGCGGGGGGAGGTGGAGGFGILCGSTAGAAGGAGGAAATTVGTTTTGGSGGNGSDGNFEGASGGGGGGAHGSVATGTSNSSGTIVGGAGGNGGSSGLGGGGGGGGGGGFGVSVYSESPITYTATNSGTITGGNGGNGGHGNIQGGIGGNGGIGGAGIYAVSGATINVNTTVTGGNGGVGGNGGGTGASGGNGGDGIVGSNATIVLNSGATVQGGSGGAGGLGQTLNGSGGNGGNGISGSNLTITINPGAVVTGGLPNYGDAAEANYGSAITGSNLTIVDAGQLGTNGGSDRAVTFTGGVNSLTLQGAPQIYGNLVASSTSDTLVLGGAINQGSGTIYTPYIQGFGVVQKTGSSEWILSGAADPLNGPTGWNVTDGTLIFVDNGGSSNTSRSFGSGTITLNGGGIDSHVSGPPGTAVSLANTITLGVNGGTIGVGGSNQNLTIINPIIGQGRLTIDGGGDSTHPGGTMTLGVANSYAGATTVTGGVVVAVGNSAAFSTGAVKIQDGSILQFAQNNLTLANAVTLIDPGETIDTQANTAALSGVISGDFGGLTKIGTGTLILSGANTYSQGTTVSGGTLQGDTTSLQGDIVNNANVTFNQTGSGSYGGSMSGTGGLTLTGTGTVTLTGDNNTYTGATTVSGGTLAFSSASKFANDSTSVVNLANAGTVLDVSANGSTVIQALSGVVGSTVNLGNDELTVGSPGANTTFAGVIQGSGDLVATLGTLTLTGANTYTGGTTVASAALVVGNAAALSSGPVTLSNQGTLRFALNNLTVANAISLNNLGDVDTQGNTATLSGVISGGGLLGKIGTGTLVLSGANTYTGGTSVDGGTLSISSDSNLGTGGTVFLRPGTTLAFTAGGTYTHAIQMPTTEEPTLSVAAGQTVTQTGIISGTGQLTVTGGGTLVLAAANTYTGATTVTGSTLLVNGSIAASSGLTTASSAVIGGAGALPATTIDGTSTLAPGAAPTTIGALSVNGNLTLQNGAGYLADASPTAADTVNVSGAASIAGASVNLNNLGGTYTVGQTYQYVLINAPGGLTGTFGSVYGTSAFGSQFIGTVSYNANQAILNILPATYVWNTAPGSNDWNTASNWNFGLVPTVLSTAVFGASNTTNVSVQQENTQVQGLIFNPGASAYTINVTGTPGTPSSLVIGPGGISNNSGTPQNFAVSGVSGADGTLQITGGSAADSILTANSLGTIQFTGTATGGTSQLVANNGGTIDISGLTNGGLSVGAISGLGNFVLGGNTLSTGSLNTSTTVAGLISGVGGSLTKTGSGTLTLSGNNSYTGGTTINGGTLAIANSGAVGTGAVAMTDGTTLQFAVNNLTLANALGLAGTDTVDTQGNSATLGGVISGTGALSKIGSGTLTLGGANSYSGGTTVSSGVLAGTTTSLQGNILDNANVTFNQSSNGTYAGSVSGSGSLTTAGAGTVTLSGANSYSGATTIGAGTLALARTGSISGSSGINLAAAGTGFDISGGGNQTIQGLSGVAGSTVSVGANTLTFGSGTSSIFAGSFTGSGGLNKQVGGTVTLTGDSSGFTGVTTIGGGTLAVGSQAAPSGVLGGAVNVLSGGTLSGHGTVGTVTNLSGTVSPGGSIGTLTVNGNYTQGAAGTLRIEVSPTASSQLVVKGNATLGGTLALLFDPGTYQPRNYTFLTANSITGAFATVTGTPPSGFNDSTLIGAATGQLVLSSPQNDTVFTAMTSTLVQNSQQATGMVLDRLGSRLGGIVDGPMTVASAVPSAGAPLAQHGAGNLAAFDQMAEALPQAITGEGGWFRGIGGFASVNSNSTTPGFNAQTGGFMAGFDRDVLPGMFAGLAGGYTHSNVQEHSISNTGTIDTVRVIAYGGGTLGAGLWSATLGYANDSIDTSRSVTAVGIATEGHSGNEFTFGGQFSRPVDIDGFGGGVVTLTPRVGVQGLYLSQGGFSETGASGFNLKANSGSTNSIQPYIGISAAQVFATGDGMLFAPELRLGYSREVAGNSRNMTVNTLDGTTFLVAGVRPALDMLSAGVGVSVRTSENLYVYGNYDTVLPTGNTIQQSVSAGLRLRF